MIPRRKILEKYSADNWLDCDTAFFNFPKLFYQNATIENYEIFFEDITQEDIESCYDEEYDSWSCRIFNYISYYGREKKVNTYQNPPLTVILEHYDLEIANQFVKKEHDYLIKPSEVDHSKDFVNHSYLKITMYKRKNIIIYYYYEIQEQDSLQLSFFFSLADSRKEVNTYVS